MNPPTAMIRRVAAALMILASTNSPSHAANIRVASVSVGHNKYGDKCAVAEIALTGEIVRGDVDSLQKVIQSIAPESKKLSLDCGVNGGSSEALIVMSLNSEGGDYAEGWKMAKVLQEKIIATLVRDGNQCLSACAIMFLAGSVIGSEGGTGFKRTIMPRARLGFHAPFPILPDRTFAHDEVIAAFEGAFKVYSEFMEKSSEFGVPLEVVPQLLQPTPNETFDIDNVQRAMSLNIGITFGPTMEFSDIYGITLPFLSLSYFNNACINYYERKTHRDVSIADLVTYMKQQNLAPYHMIKASTLHWFGTDDNDALFVVPVDFAPELNLQMCVFAVTKEATTNKLQSACLGFVIFGDYSEIDDYVKKSGVQGLVDRTTYGTDCGLEFEYAALPGKTKLADIPSAMARLAAEPAIFPPK